MTLSPPASEIARMLSRLDALARVIEAEEVAKERGDGNG